MHDSQDIEKLKKEQEANLVPYQIPCHNFDPITAISFGVDHAILIRYFQVYIQENINNDKDKIDGRTWFFNTIKLISFDLPYFSEQKVKRLIKSLINQRIILRSPKEKGCLHKFFGYAFVNQEFFVTEKGVMNHE